MKFTPTELPDVICVEPQVFGDARGYFMETYHVQKYSAGGITAEFFQDNQSGSTHGILRGLHYQIRQPQGKLVRVVSGEVFDVAVDIRRSSPTFGRWVGMVLSAANRRMLWVPAGFAHGYLVLSDWAEFVYKTTDFYAPQFERSLRWDDPQIGINWPLAAGEQPILNARDAAGNLLADAEVYD